MFDVNPSSRALGVAEISSGLVSALLQEQPRPTILREVACAGGRIDLLAVSSYLHGFEIKSDNDNLARVASQTMLYGDFCDQLTFVSGPRHAVALLRSVPAWCGVKVVTCMGDERRILELRESRLNPGATALSAAQLLLRDELVEVADHPSARRITRTELCKYMASAFSFEEVRSKVGAMLKRRQRVADAQQTLHDDLSLLRAISLDCQFS
jgi:hypothetical protein